MHAWKFGAATALVAVLAACSSGSSKPAANSAPASSTTPATSAAASRASQATSAAPMTSSAPSQSPTADHAAMADWFSKAKQPLDLWIEDLQTLQSLSAIGDAQTTAGVCAHTKDDTTSFQPLANQAPDPVVAKDLTLALASSFSATMQCSGIPPASDLDDAVQKATAAQARAQSLH